MIMTAVIKEIEGTEWQWAEEYVYAVATYVVSCPADRRCQVGMGVFVNGSPMGEKIRFSGTEEITVIGAGSLHFRVDDGKGPCKIGFSQSNNKPLSWPWSV